MYLCVTSVDLKHEFMIYDSYEHSLENFRESSYGCVNNNNSQVVDNCERRVIVSRASLYLSTSNSFRPDAPHDARGNVLTAHAVQSVTPYRRRILRTNNHRMIASHLSRYKYRFSPISTDERYTLCAIACMAI